MNYFRSTLLFSIVLLLTACETPTNEDSKRAKKGVGGMEYGGVFSVNEIEDFRSLYPLNITDVTGHRVGNQIFEGLVKLDQESLEPVAGIAESWKVDDSGTRYTFTLRKGVFFHDDPCFPEGKGREVKADDVKYCLDRLCQAASDNVMFSYFTGRVKGADHYYEQSVKGKLPAGGVDGVKVLDEYTVSIELEYPFGSFLQIMSLPACWIYPSEAVELYGQELRAHAVGTGPFRKKVVREGEVVILERNPDYWGRDQYGNALPYLDAIRYTFIKEKKTELMEFMKGNLDMLYDPPAEDVASLKQQARIDSGLFSVQSVPAMVIQYYGFQHESELFSNVHVRKAFNYAIDREQIVQYALQGRGFPAHHGIVPPSFREYNTASIKGYSYSPEKARHHMAMAGYPNGEGFPVLTLQLNYGGSVHVQVAEVIQKMLEENLNLNIELTLIPRAQHYERVETGRALFWRDGWSADYPDPENFLNLFYGALVPDDINQKSYINSIRYRSDDFDDLFESALRETDQEKRMKLFQQADQVAMDDAAIIPLYYEEAVRVVQGRVQNFPINALEYRDFSRVRFSQPATAAS
ncbi:MAG: ABC transporter substrate-binding protein [Cryomorphaceae bacterium]|nr:MAG: ABC transporter substrate-binding protein [Cryomorphaceae bacterium]